MAHPYHMHREHQVSHRRVKPMLRDEPSGVMEHNDSRAFSKVTSKSAAESHDGLVSGGSSPKRYARGGKVKHGHQTNIAIVNPSRPAPPTPSPAGPMPGAAPPAPAAGGMPPGMPPGGPPGMMRPPMGAPPPGMPMHKRGGRVHKAGGGGMSGESTKGNIKAWGKEASKNSYARGGRLPDAGAASGVGREEKARMKKR